MNYLETIASDYEQAEVTYLYLHDKATKANYNLFTIIELVPVEQAPSAEIGNELTKFLAREGINQSHYSVGIGRAIGLCVEEGIQIYARTDGRVTFKYKTLDFNVSPLPFASQEIEPPYGYPLVIKGKTELTFGKVLPHRSTGFRVWAKLDRNKKWLKCFDNKTKSAIFSSAGKLTLKYLGFDISKIPEHFGNTYLCGCNPYLRSYETSLLDYKTDLLIRFRERLGKSVIGTKLVLQENRADNIGFTIEKRISSNLESIQLPYLPAALVTQLYDGNENLLEVHSGVWTNLSFQMEIYHSTLNLSVNLGDETEQDKIEKYVTEKAVSVGNYDHSLSRYLKEEYQKRDFERLEANKEFIFFPGNPGDKQKAKKIIAGIIKNAEKRIILLDPYFGAGDLSYAFQSKRLSVPI